MQKGPTEAAHRGTRLRVEQKQQWRSKPLLQADGYIVFRFDEFNFVLVERAKHTDSEHYFYYPTLASAAEGLLHKAIDATEKPGIQAVLERIAEAKREILEAVLSLKDTV